MTRRGLDTGCIISRYREIRAEFWPGMPPISPDLVSTVVNAGKDILKEASDLTSGRDPNYIRDAEPGNVFDAIALEAARQGCRRYQQKGGDYSSRRAARAERACRPYLDSLEPDSGPQAELPFRGGQCDTNGGGYIVVARLNRAGGGTTDYTRRIRGPLGGVRVRQVNQTQGVAEINSKNSTPNTNCSIGLPDQGQAWRTFATQSEIFAPSGGASISIISITPCPDTPDVCGNPPIDVTPPRAPVAPLPPGPRPFVRAPDIDVDVNVTINPDFSINVDIGTGPITIDPFADDDGGGDGGGGGDPGDPTDPGSPGGGVSTGPGGDQEGEAPPGQEIVGLLVTVTGSPDDANRFANNSKQPFRGIGYIRMGYPGRLGLDITGGTVISPQFFHAPQRGLTNWAVSANIGFNLTIVPYYRSIEE